MADLKRTEIFELGRKGPYFRFTDYPFKVSEEIRLYHETEPRKSLVQILKEANEWFEKNVDISKLDKIRGIEHFVNRQKKCNCSIQILMSEGCKCGGI